MRLRCVHLVFMIGCLAFVLSASAQSMPDAGELKLKAESGDVIAANAYAESCFGRFYFSESVKWFQIAAEAGITNAQWHLGEMLLHGKSFLERSVAAKPAEGFRWLQHAALQGHTESQWEVGRAFKDGVGAKRDLDQAFYWLQIAASQGHILAGVIRDQMVTKMSAADVQRIRERASEFRPFARDVKQVLWDGIKLKGIFGTASHRLALINETTLGDSEVGTLKMGAGKLRARCSQITPNSAVVELIDVGDKRQLRLDLP